MIKNQASSEAFTERSGSFSTHGSRKGINLLGWGEEEILTPVERRDALIRAQQKVDSEVVETKARLRTEQSPDEVRALQLLRDEQRDRLSKIHSELAELNIQLGRAKQKVDLGDYLIKMFKKRVTKHEWACIVAEAKRLQAAGFPVDDL